MMSVCLTHTFSSTSYNDMLALLALCQSPISSKLFAPFHLEVDLLPPLNKACPKDDFPFSHIDVLVDNNTGSALMSFMDGF